MSTDRINVNTQAVRPVSVHDQQRPIDEAKKAEVAAPVVEQPEEVQSVDHVKEVARQLDAYLRSVSRSLEFRVDADSGRTIVTVRDAQTGDVIRQIPGEEVLRLAQMAHDDTIVLLRETA
jgi:flagellar protein FlaG